MTRVKVNCEALDELARQLAGLRGELDIQGDQLAGWAPVVGHRRVTEALDDFAENWGKARAKVSERLAELSDMASGCATFYREREAALAGVVGAAGSAPGPIGPVAPVLGPVAPVLGPVAPTPAPPRTLGFPDAPRTSSTMGDWSALAEVNPVRGDPWGVCLLAGHLTERAGMVSEVATALGRIETGEDWDGEAAAAFAEHRGDAIPRLALVEARDQATAAALRTYATGLETALEEAETARIAAVAAQSQIEAARSGAAAHECSVEAALRSGAVIPVTLGISWDARLEEARRAMAGARRQLDDAIYTWDCAAGSAGEGIRRAIDDDLKDPKRNLFQRAAGGIADRFPGLGALADWAGKISGALGIFAAVCTATGVLAPLAALAATGAVIAGSVSLAANTILWGAGRGSLVKVGLDAAGLLTFGFGRAATSAARGTAGAFARSASDEIVGVAGRQLVQQGTAPVLANSFRTVTVANRRQVMRQLRTFADDLGENAPASLLPNARHWGEASHFWRPLALPADELLAAVPRANGFAVASKVSDGVGVIPDLIDVGIIRMVGDDG
ncbi:MAG: putative T7SS-secreted protein [Acidimicrobiia bacterium]